MFLRLTELGVIRIVTCPDRWARFPRVIAASCSEGHLLSRIQPRTSPGGLQPSFDFWTHFTALLKGSQASYVPQTLEMHPSLLKLTGLNKLKGALAFKFYKAGLSLSGEPRPGEHLLSLISYINWALLAEEGRQPHPHLGSILYP